MGRAARSGVWAALPNLSQQQHTGERKVCAAYICAAPVKTVNMSPTVHLWPYVRRPAAGIGGVHCGGPPPAPVLPYRGDGRSEVLPAGLGVRIVMLTPARPRSMSGRQGAMAAPVRVLNPAVPGDPAVPAGKGGRAHLRAFRGEFERTGRAVQRGPHSYTSTLRSWTPENPSARPADRAVGTAISEQPHQQHARPSYCALLRLRTGGGFGAQVTAGLREG